MALIKYLSVVPKHVKCHSLVETQPLFLVCKPVKNRRLWGSAVIPVRFYFHEPSRKGDTKYDRLSERTIPEHISLGYSIFKRELQVFYEEMKEKFRADPKIFKHGDTYVEFRFENEEDLKKWKSGSDSTYNEGFSHCNLELNNDGKAVFSGVIDNTIPKDGRVRRAGFCTMKSKDKQKSFMRMDSFKYWERFTHLELRVRGDGRNYVIGLGLNAYIDIHWMDLYTYALHTRGGPYWQTVKIPFSKFFLTSKGVIQDKQYPLPKAFVTSISITVAKIPGPFRLEIDYIGVHKDDSYVEEFAYELYQFPKYLVSIG